MPVGAFFERPAAPLAYKVVYGDPHGAAGLIPQTAGPPTPDLQASLSAEAAWYYLPDPSVRNIFNAIYTPNAPDSEDWSDAGIKAIPYTPELSAGTLSLFTVTLGAEAAQDRIELSGTPPAVPGADSGKPVVIDIGLPDQEAGALAPSAALPAFVIPFQGLGTEGEDYGHIRLRVNRGAVLVINPDPATEPSPGFLTAGTLEVMADGKLQGGGIDGSPLGQNLVLLNRLLSYRSPDPQGPWLIGPAGNSAAIEWGVGDQNGDYFEVRGDKAAFSANITIKKSLTLHASVWFINSPAMTIDAQPGTAGGGKKGLFYGGGDPGAYRFYGTSSNSGGENPAKASARIILRPGNALDPAFLTGLAEADITAGDNEIIILNQGLGDAKTYDNMRGGFPVWLLPEGVSPE
jgi:hypothetical protein